MRASTAGEVSQAVSVDWKAIRREFPALQNWTFLNTATFGQLPRAGVEASAKHYAHRDELACADFLDWYSDMDRVRAKIARLINAEPDDIAFVTHAAAALGMLVCGISWRPGEQVLTLEDEFPNQLYIPALSERFGVEFRSTGWDRFEEALTPQTRLVAVSEVNYATGFRLPVEALSRMLGERGIVLFVDGTQSAGALRVDCSRARPGMLAVHGYKWMLSPTGAAFMYVDRGLRPKLPPNVAGWRSDRGWRDVDSLHHGAPRLKDSAEKYEGGGLPIPLLYAMEQSVDMMLEIGPDVIEERVLALANRARRMLQALGADVDSHAGQIVTARFEGRDPSGIAKALRERRVLVAARHGRVRVSPHFYNDESDLEALSDALRKIL